MNDTSIFAEMYLSKIEKCRKVPTTAYCSDNASIYSYHPRFIQILSNSALRKDSGDLGKDQRAGFVETEIMFEVHPYLLDGDEFAGMWQ